MKAQTVVYIINTVLNVAVLVDLVTVRSMNLFKPKPWYWIAMTVYGGLALLDAELYAKVGDHFWEVVCSIGGGLLMTGALVSYNKAHKKDDKPRFFDRNDIWPV